MASIMRYRGGVVRYYALLPYHNTSGAAADAIEVGDLVYVSGGNAYPASKQSDAGTAAQNRSTFAAAFAGVALQKVGLQTGETSFKLTTDPGYLMVAVSGDFEFDCASTSWAS